MRSGAISGAPNPCAAIAAAIALESGVSNSVRRLPPNRRSSTSMIRLTSAACVTSGRNSTISRVPDVVHSHTPAGAPGPPKACASSGKASAGRGSIARAMISASYARAPGMRCTNSDGSTPSGPSTRMYVRGTGEDACGMRMRTPSRASAATRSYNAGVGAASMRKVRAQSTMRTSLAA